MASSTTPGDLALAMLDAALRGDDDTLEALADLADGPAEADGAEETPGLADDPAPSAARVAGYRDAYVRARLAALLTGEGDATVNAFCPTGKDGGQDNSCPPPGAGKGKSEPAPAAEKGGKGDPLHAQDHKPETGGASLSSIKGPGGERWRNVGGGRAATHEGVATDKAKTLTREESRDVIAWHDGMAMGGKNEPNKSIGDGARPQLTDLERGALQKYTYKNDGPLNQMLRGSAKDSADGRLDYRTKDGPATTPYSKAYYEEMHAGLNSAFSKAKTLDKPVTVYRGLTLEGDALKGFLEKMKPGAETTMGGGFSSSAVGGLTAKLGLTPGVPAAFRGNVEFKINAVHGLDLLPHTQLAMEKEFLLHDKAKFTVKSVKQDRKGNYKITLDQHPPKASDFVANLLRRLAASDGLVVNAAPAPREPQKFFTGDPDSPEAEAWLAEFYKRHPEAAEKWLGDGTAGLFETGEGEAPADEGEAPATANAADGDLMSADEACDLAAAEAGLTPEETEVLRAELRASRR